MLKVSRGDAGSMSAQRRRNRRAAATSDSLASLTTLVPSDNNSTMLPSSSSSSARKKHSKHHHHRLSTPSSLEQIATTAAATPIIPAEESSSTAAPRSPNRNNSSSSNKNSAKSKHSGKRSHLSMVSSLSSLAMDADTQSLGGSSSAASPQKKSPKKKRHMSPRSKSKLDSLVTQQQPQQVEDDTEEKESETLQQQRLQGVKNAESIAKGSLVMVQPRTWPGMNKLGGVGRVTAVHSSTSYDLDSSQQEQQMNEDEGGSSRSNIIDASTTTTYDVSYVLGGKDKNIEAEYVSVHDANLEAPRERHQRTFISTTKPEKGGKSLPKKNTVTKKKKVMKSTVTTKKSPTKEKEASKKGTSIKTNSSVRGKQLRQLKQVKDQHVAAVADAEGSTANNLKSPAFSLSSQFSKQDGAFSPLDYLADSYPKIDTPVLETYAEKWGYDNGPKKVGQQQNGEEDEEEERDDDPSSSVVSTDEDESGFTPPKRRRKRASPVKYASSGRRKEDMSPPSENKNLEREYGRLALKKQEIERKMKIYKSDAEKINPWAASSVSGSNIDTSGNSLLGNSSPGRSEAVGRRSGSIRDVADGNDYPITRYNRVGVPSREEVEFGELVYKRNMTDRRMAELKDGYPKRTKPKKKRRRRVVETITRVIHEESEDDGSSVSDRHLQIKGGRYGSPDRSYMSQKPTNMRQSFDRRRSDSSDSELAGRSREQYYAHQYSSSHPNHTQDLQSRKQRYPEPEQAASGTNRKTKSRTSSMLEELD